MLASCSLKGADSSESLKMGSTSSGEPPGNMTSVICRLPSSISGSRCRQAAMSRTLAASTGAAAVWCSAESWSAAISAFNAGLLITSAAVYLQMPPFRRLHDFCFWVKTGL